MSHARDIALALGGVWRGGKAVVCCPAHDDKTPSMSVTETRDGRALVHCHANCSQLAVISALRAKGLWDGEAKGDPCYPGHLTRPHDGMVSKDDRQRRDYAREVWDMSDPLTGTLSETYLRSRKITLGKWPDDLGHVNSLMHFPTGKKYPALVAAVRDRHGEICAVQRTWLRPDGSGKADLLAPKMTVGPLGDAAVALGRAGPYMGLAEGVETALSASIMYAIPVWATLSANRLGKIKLPAVCESLVIFADAGTVGINSANEAAEVYERAGLAVDVMPPAVHFGDADDFNTALQAMS